MQIGKEVQFETNILFGIFTGVIKFYYMCSRIKDAVWLPCIHCTNDNKWLCGVKRSNEHSRF